MLKRRFRAWRAASLPIAFAVAIAIPAQPALGQAAARVTSPKAHFGHNIGDDYWLATYDQFMEYWRKLDGESDRMQVVEIGRTAENRPQLMAIVTAPGNFAKLDRYKEIARRLATAEGLTDEQAQALAREGKAVVWIDGGLHATEVLGAHQLMETVYQLVSRTDEETQRILDDCIVLAVHANPDGMQLVSSWYMKDADTLKRAMNIPRLYQKYIGHDNNRDFYVANQPESRNMNHVMYWEWFPQIVYNHHQTGPAGTVMFAPPFRDPFNYNYDPLIPVGIDMVGASMHDRFIRENKPGVTMRSGASYSTWWNGGLRTMVYFHNMIGLLTETIGNPTPMRIPFIPQQQLPRGDLPYPIEPQPWRFRQSIDYSVTANYAVLDIASRRRDHFLYNIYRMGKNSIERGSRDHWTTNPKDVAAAQDVVETEREAVQNAQLAGAQRAGAPRAGAQAGQGAVGSATTPFGAGANPKIFSDVLRDPAKRDARGYIIPASQRDFPTATKFVNSLRHAGVVVHRATRDFTVSGKSYPAGSFVVKTAQAFRPHVLDMFEPQDHPNDFAYPGGPPRRPYDNAGWTLAYQMGVQFDRVLDGFDGPFERVEGLAKPAPGAVTNAEGAAGFVFSHTQNDAFAAIARLLEAKADVFWTKRAITAGGRTYPAGTFYVAASGAALPVVRSAASELGVSFVGTRERPADATKLSAPRIALWDQYGGSMPSGHTRWLLEQFGYDYKVVYPQELDAGNLKNKYDVIVLVDGAISEGGGRGGRGGQGPQNVPAEFQPMLGRITAERTVPQLRRFLNEGGSVIAIGSSTALAGHLDLPLGNALTERTPTGGERALPADKFYVPGSILRATVDTSAGVAAGLPGQVDVFFDNSPAFRLEPGALLKGVRPIAWFDTETPLRSGWAWGQNYLKDAVAIAEASVGRGKLYLFGPEILFRGQPHGTFKFFFNALHNGGAGQAIVP